MNPFLVIACVFLIIAFKVDGHKIKKGITSFQPTQVHIALAGQGQESISNTMAVSWNTIKNTASSVVKYGLTTGQYTESSTGTSRAYYETFNHHVVLNELSPNTKYYYVVGDETGGFSKEYSFVSAPLSSALRGNFSFFVFGDLGVTNGDPSTQYINNNKDSVNLIWHAGDVGYADDSFLHLGCAVQFCYEDTFDTYLNNVEPWASEKPYMVAVGNHEADCHDPACLLDKDRRNKLSNFTAYNDRFRMPSPESKGTLNMHYSFNYGNVHFITIDTETGFPGAPEETRYVLPCGGFAEQLNWLEQDLIKANSERSIRPWIFASGHRPFYNGDSINTGLQGAMEELFYKYGVDVYFAGHEHSYERDYPTYQGVPEKTYNDPSATTHLLIGGAGNDEMKNIQLDRFRDPSPIADLYKKVFLPQDGSWTVVTDKDNHVGIGKITIVDDSKLEFQYIRTTTGEVFDSVTLVRDHSKYMKK
eukprot:gene11236-15077_t